MANENSKDNVVISEVTVCDKDGKNVLFGKNGRKKIILGAVAAAVATAVAGFFIVRRGGDDSTMDE